MKNTVKEAQSVVDVFVSDGKHKGVSCPVEHEGETNIRKENEMIFYLREAPEYRISAVAEWRENSRGDILTAEPDTYFRHVRTGARCESVWLCLAGWSEPGEAQEKWDTLCERIEEIENLEQTICDEKSVEV